MADDLDLGGLERDADLIEVFLVDWISDEGIEAWERIKAHIRDLKAAHMAEVEHHARTARELAQAEAATAAAVGWQLADDVPVWSDGIVTDGERAAIAQKAEADYGGTYWATDGGDDCLYWEPTHFAALPSTPPVAEEKL